VSEETDPSTVDLRKERPADELDLRRGIASAGR